jgi:hypothetical protein
MHLEYRASQSYSTEELLDTNVSIISNHGNIPVQNIRAIDLQHDNVAPLDSNQLEPLAFEQTTTRMKQNNDDIAAQPNTRPDHF